VIDVLYFADKAVKQKLFARAGAAPKLTLVTVLPPHRAISDPESLEPFATLERDFGSVVDQVLVVDEGKVEGMWRDPVVDLADSIYATDAKAAYAAARGYFFVHEGKPKLTVKKTNDPAADLEELEKAVERLTMRRAPPRPRAHAREPEPARQASEPREPTTLEDAAPLDAYAVLGIQPGASLDQARQAWKALIVQYHPDKVAHLGPEFRELAEKKTRELMQAWEQVQAVSR
jgi:hypothetical protein